MPEKCSKSAQSHPSARRGAEGPEDTPEPTSADEPALVALIESLSRKYHLYEDVAATAYTELLAERGPLFPLCALVDQAQRVYWRQQAERRRQGKLRSAYLPKPAVTRDDDAGKVEIDVVDAITPERRTLDKATFWNRQLVEMLKRPPWTNAERQARHRAKVKAAKAPRA